MFFSNRTPEDLSKNKIAAHTEKMSLTGFLDLTQSNPTQCGLSFPNDILKALQDPSGMVYEPHPFGLLRAREDLAAYLNARGEKAKPENILLTSCTSEAYSYLFKLLADPGDNILIPHPGYPLMEHLTRMDGLLAVPYPLLPKSGWPLDRGALEAAVQTNTRLVTFVNPHNPTGSFLKPGDYQFLSGLCQRRRIPLLLDEVFSEYGYTLAPPFKPDNSDTLIFRLGGLSKSLGLPQLKLSWITLQGPEDLLRECRNRLELIADTYLSVNTPVQCGLKKLLEIGPSFQKQLLDRVLKNRSHLVSSLKGQETTSTLWPSEGGWYSLVELKNCPLSEEDFIVQLLEKERVLVQPGGFYDFSSGFFLVISLLPEKEIFEEGIKRLIHFLSSIQG